MKLSNIGHSFDYEMEKLIRLFLPFEKIQVFHTVEKSENCAICTLYDGGGKTFAKAQLYLNEKSAEFITEVDYTAKDIKKESQHTLGRQLFFCFEKLNATILILLRMSYLPSFFLIKHNILLRIMFYFFG